MNKKLEQLRKQIDEADSALIAILAKRVDISSKIGALKKKSGLHAIDAAREKHVIESRIETGKKKTLSPVFVRKLFKLIHDESVRIQKNI